MMMNRNFTPPKILLPMYWVSPSAGLDILKKKITIPRRPVTIPTEPFRPVFLGLSITEVFPAYEHKCTGHVTDAMPLYLQVRISSPSDLNLSVTFFLSAEGQM